MQDRTFDRLTKSLAKPPTRRGFIGGLGALVAAGMGMSQVGQRRTFEKALAQAQDDPGEQSVLLLEELGRLAESHSGNCSKLRKSVRDFEKKYQDLLDSLRADEKTWSVERRTEHADTYADRRMAVVDQIKAAIESCESVSESAVPAGAAVSGASMVGAARTGQGAIRSFAQADTGCTQDNHNFLLEAYCAKQDSDWTSPSFQWPAYCPSYDIDGSCELCAEDTSGNHSNPGICTEYWPQDCVGSNGQNICDVEYHQSHGGTAGAMCGDDSTYVLSAPARCYSRNSDWNSPEFSWNVYCPKGYVDHDCIDCIQSGGSTQPDICVEYWPQDCQTSEGNICYVGFHVDDTEVCCHNNCPTSTSDCVISAFALAYGSYECGACMLSWCGSTASCLEHCASEDCCDEACSSDPTPPPPDGGMVRGHGTPVPNATPVLPGTPHPSTPVPLEPTPPGTPYPSTPVPLEPTPPGTPEVTPVPLNPTPPGTPVVPPATPYEPPFVPPVPPATPYQPSGTPYATPVD